MRRAACVVAALAVIAGVVVGGSARAEESAEAGPTSDCSTPNRGDRTTTVVSPSTTLNQVSIHLSVEAGDDGAGVHLEPWARRAYFVDAGADGDGVRATTRVDGDDGRGDGYLNADLDSTGRACISSPSGGVGVTTGAPDADDGDDPDPGTGDGADVPTAPSPAARIVAGPMAQTAGYVTREVSAENGAAVLFHNLDMAPHNVVALDRDTGTGEPYFRSGTVAFDGETPLVFVDGVPDGTYAFYCSLHPSMTGSLTLT